MSSPGSTLSSQCAMRFCTKPVAVDDPSFCGPPCRAYGVQLKRELENDLRRARLEIARSEPEYQALSDALSREA